MKEVLAIVIVILMWAFAATKAEWYYVDPSLQTVLSPVYSHIDQQKSQNRSQTIASLSKKIETTNNTYVKTWLSEVMLYLISKEDAKDTSIYSSFIE